MQIRCSVFIATSLDGFIAKPDGDIEWLHDPSYTIKGEDFGYSEFIQSVDALLIGRHTFEKMLTFGEWYTKPVIVLTSKELSIPEHLSGKVQCMSGEPAGILKQASELGFRHFYVDGGLTIQRFLNAGLIDKLTITKIPVLLGEGIPLFGPLEEDLKLKLLSSSEFENGFVQLVYKPEYK